MPLFLILGSAGTGKSTVCRSLKDKGYEAYDVDNDGFAKWQNTETGFVHPKSSVKKAARTPDFLKLHAWNVPRSEVEELHDKAAKHLVFLCGIIDNEAELHDLFDGIFALHVDDETLKHRLAKRPDNDWGKQEHELKQTLERHHVIYDTWRGIGATVIDAARPVEVIVEDIVSRASQVQ